MKKIFKFGFVFLAVFIFGGFLTLVHAEDLPIPPSEIIPPIETPPDPVPIPVITFIIRNGDSVLYNGSVSLPSAGTVSINDSNNAAHTINARSVLAVLKNIDDGSGDFSISNLQYYDSFGSFYLKCILPNGGSELCDNWQYAVGSLTPFSGIDATILSGGETVGIYFGASHRVVLSTNSITTGGSLNATSEKYIYTDNTWNPLTGVSVGVTLPNPADPFNPTVVSTHPVDAQGNVSITITGVNTYTLGIAEDFYFPTYVVNVSAPPNSGGGGGGYIQPIFNVSNAMAYLKNLQNADGSFGGADLYTDWVAIAFGAFGVNDSSKDKLLAYFNAHNTLSTILTDNERRAMALLALGQNPYSFSGVNYINAIINSFDGSQFGDANLVNDDIFALIPLKNSGYGAGDDIITKDIAFLIAKQNTDGSWEESTDITAAAVQALKPFETVAGVADSLLKAANYLANGQNNNGSWGSIYSTSWTMQAMNSLSASWTKNGFTPSNYLGLQQTSDGAVLSSSETPQNQIWAISYAIPAALFKPWNAIMQSVPKSETQNGSNIILPNKEINLVATAASVAKKNINKKSDDKKISAIARTQTKSSLQILPANTDILEEITSDMLTATVANALATKNIPKNLPIVLGTVSGLILLSVALKFFIVS